MLSMHLKNPKMADNVSWVSFNFRIEFKIIFPYNVGLIASQSLIQSFNKNHFFNNKISVIPIFLLRIFYFATDVWIILIFISIIYVRKNTIQ